MELAIEGDGAPHTENGGCEVQDETHVVAMIPLMRALGTHANISSKVLSTTTTLLDETYDPHHVLYTTPSSVIDLTAGSQFFTACTFVNNTGLVVHDGESATNELCLSGNYRYPPKPPTNHSPLDCPIDLML